MRGQEALVRLEIENFDLVLLDSLMPELGGIEVLKEIRMHPVLKQIPVMIISGLDESESVARSIELGADDYVPSPLDPGLLVARIDASLEKRRLRQLEELIMKQIQLEKAHSERLVNAVIPIGISLLKETNYHRLLERILDDAMSLCFADGGTLYLRKGDELHFTLLKNNSHRTELGGNKGPIPYPPLPLHDPETGDANHSLVACHVALSGKSVNIADAYDAEGFDFRGTRAFDEKTGYRSVSFLTAPLKNEDGSVIGVLQLINATNKELDAVIPFDPTLQRSVESLGQLAAAAIERCDEGEV